MGFEFKHKNCRFGFKGKTINSNEQLAELPVEFIERMAKSGVLVKINDKSKKEKDNGEQEKKS